MAQSAQIQKVSGWHERLADWLILNPTRSQAEAAKEFGVTQSWLSTVINSDAFRDHFHRKSQAHSESLLATVREKTLGVAGRAIDMLGEKLDTMGEAAFSVKDLVEIADMTLKRTGHGEPRGPAAAAVQVNVGLVTKDELREARERMRSSRVQVLPAGHEGAGSQVIDLHPIEPGG